MPFVIALLGLIGGALFWYYRMRAAGQAAQDLAGVAQDVMSTRQKEALEEISRAFRLG